MSNFRHPILGRIGHGCPSYLGPPTLYTLPDTHFIHTLGVCIKPEGSVGRRCIGKIQKIYQILGYSSTCYHLFYLAYSSSTYYHLLSPVIDGWIITYLLSSIIDEWIITYLLSSVIICSRWVNRWIIVSVCPYSIIGNAPVL